MSDAHSNQGQSLKGTTGQGIEPSREEIDAGRATISADQYHEQHEFHDSRYWHAACRVPDCRLGFPECKVGSSCSKQGWKNALEKPLHRSRSLAMASKRPESVAMLPPLLSNLAVSRTCSDPCIFGKDFLRITLPLPGEPSDCRAKGHAVEESESCAFENMVSCEPMNLFGLGTREDNPVLEASTSPFPFTSEEIMSKTGVSSGIDSLFFVQNSGARTQDDDESIHHIVGPRIDDMKELEAPAPDIASLRNEMGISQDFGVIFSDKTPIEVNAGLGEWSMGNFGDTSFDETAANSPMKGVSNISRTPQWDDWWTCRSNECSDRSRHAGMQCRSKSKEHYLASAEETEIDQVEEEGSDEGYLVLEEHEDQQLGRFEDEGDACDDGEEESIFYSKQYSDSDFVEEELPKEGEMDADNSSKGYKEDDIWSDEHFVSSQVKGFPPPISILANETHPGLPGHMPRTLWRSVKRDGRFVLQEVQAQPREFFRATREFGRLRLQLVRPDSDPVGNYTEVVDVCNEDSAGAVSIASSSIETLAGISDTNKSEDHEIVHKGDMSGSSTQGIETLQPEDSWTAEKGAKSGAALDQGGSELVGRLIPSTSLPKECGSVLEGETPGACSFQNCTEKFEVRPSSDAGLDDAGLKEVPDPTGGDAMIEDPCVTNHSHISEESWGALSDTVKVDDREKLFGLCPCDEAQVLAVGIPLDMDHEPIVGQIDGDRKVDRMGVVNLCTKLEVGQVEGVEDLVVCNHRNVVMPPVHGHEEQFRQDYQHPCFNTAYGFDNNLNVLSPSQKFMQFPIQPAVR